MIKAERHFISMLLLLVTQISSLSTWAATDAEQRCEYLHCSIESFLVEFSDERLEQCVALAKQTENTVFKGHFDQIMFWVNHNTPSDVIQACPNKKEIVEKLVSSQERYTQEELAQIERNHIKMRPQILEGLKQRQEEHEKGIKPAPQASRNFVLPPGSEGVDLSTELKPGEAGMKEYLEKAMNITHPMPLLPEHEKGLMCEMAVCGYADHEGLMELGSENRSNCNELGALLVVKSFKGELMLFSSWIQKASKLEYLRTNCPAEVKQIEPYEKKKAEAIEKSSI